MPEKRNPASKYFITEAEHLSETSDSEEDESGDSSYESDNSMETAVEKICHKMHPSSHNNYISVL